MRPAAQARDILAAAFAAKVPGRTLTWPGMRILMAQSRQEGQWGAFGGHDAAGDYYGENWGAVQAKMGPPCPPGTFEAGDSKPSSTGQKPFRWCFLGYPTAQAGAEDFVRHAVVLRSSALDPLLKGDVWNYARILRELNYYHGFSKTEGEGADKEAMRRWEQISGYVTMIDNQGAAIDAELGVSPTPRTKIPPPPSGGGKNVGPGPKKAGRPLALIVTAASLAIPLIYGK